MDVKIFNSEIFKQYLLSLLQEDTVFRESIKTILGNGLPFADNFKNLSHEEIVEAEAVRRIGYALNQKATILNLSGLQLQKYRRGMSRPMLCTYFFIDK